MNIPQDLSPTLNLKVSAVNACAVLSRSWRVLDYITVDTHFGSVRSVEM